LFSPSQDLLWCRKKYRHQRILKAAEDPDVAENYPLEEASEEDDMAVSAIKALVVRTIESYKVVVWYVRATAYNLDAHLDVPTHVCDALSVSGHSIFPASAAGTQLKLLAECRSLELFVIYIPFIPYPTKKIHSQGQKLLSLYQADQGGAERHRSPQHHQERRR
jgi:hypothetical protein